MEQSPPGPTLVMEEPKTKMTFRVSSNESQFKVLRLAVSLGSSQIQSNVIYPELTVIYNSCTDSNDPQWSCKEVQITLTKEEEEFEFQPMSFDLYHEIKLLHHLTTIQQSPPSLISKYLTIIIIAIPFVSPYFCMVLVAYDYLIMASVFLQLPLWQPQVKQQVTIPPSTLKSQEATPVRLSSS